MFGTTPHDDPSRRAFLKTGALGVGASLLGAGATGSAAASNGDDVIHFDDYITIREPGTYVLTRDLEDRGSIQVWPGTSGVVLDGDGHAVEGNILVGDRSIGTISDVEVRNFHLPNDGLGVDRGSRILIQNNVIDSASGYLSRFTADRNTFTGRGIDLEEGSSADVTFNLFLDSGFGAQDSGSPNRVLSNYFVKGGISIEFTHSDTPERVDDNYIGQGLVHVSDADGAYVRRNVCAGSSREGIHVSDVSNGRVEDNVSFGHGGHGFDISGLVAVRGNTASHNDGDGFRLRGGQFDVRRNVAAHNEGSGFVLSESEHLRFDDIDEHLLQRNVAIGNGGDGVALDGVNRNTVKFNRVAANTGDGLAFRDSHRNEIRYNDATANGGNGLALYDADRNGITRNTLCANGGDNLLEDDESEDNRYANNTVC